MASITNSTSSPSTRQLSAGGIWNDSDPSEDIKSHACAVVSVRSDKPSAEDGIQCRWSIDKVNWDFYTYFTMSADTGNTEQDIDNCLTLTINVEHRARYFGVKYINGPIGCSALRIQTVHKAMPQSIAVENVVSTTVSGFTFVGDSLKTTSTSTLTVSDVTISGAYFDGSLLMTTVSGQQLQDNRLLTDVSGVVSVRDVSFVSDRLLVQSHIKGADTGGNLRTVATDPSGYVKIKIQDDYHLNIAQHQVNEKSAWFLSGYNTRVNDVQNPIWNSQRPLTETLLTDTCAQYINIKAYNTNDRNDSVGARSVTITGLDASWDVINETITLSTDTNRSAKRYFRVNNLEVREVGDYFGYNNGIIEAVGASSGKLGAVIDTQTSESQQLVYSVPQDKILYINGMNFNSHVQKDLSLTASDDNILVRVCVRESGDNIEFHRPVRVIHTVQGNANLRLSQYIQIPPKSDLFVTAAYHPSLTDETIVFDNTLYGYDYSDTTYSLPTFGVHGSLTGYLVNDNTYLAQESQYEILNEDYIE